MLRFLPLLILVLGLPARSGAQEWVLFGDRQMKTGNGVQVTAGDVGSNAKVWLSAGTRVADDVVTDVLVARGGSAVFGQTRLNVFDGRGNPAPALASVSSPVALPVYVLPPPPTVLTATLGSAQAPQDGSILLGPGRYQSIRAVGGQSTVVLQSGQYDVDELVVSGSNAELMCGFAPATCTIRVRTKLVLAGHLIGGTDSNVERGAVAISYAGILTVRLGRPGAIVKADVTAPLAKIRIASSRRKPSTLTGRYIAAEIAVGSRALVSDGTASSAVCGDGVVQPPAEDCDPPADGVCPGSCLPDCTCASTSGNPVLHSVGPSVLHNATDFGVQVFGENLLPGAELELRDASSGDLLVSLPTTWVSLNEVTALVPAGLPVPNGFSRELNPRVVNPGGLGSLGPAIGYCETDTPTSPIACTDPADCPAGTGNCLTGQQRLTLFNDLVFLNPNSAALAPAPHGLCDDQTPCQSAAQCAGIGSGACSAKLYVTPQQRDELWVFNTGTRQFRDLDPVAPNVQGIAVGDNPFHVETIVRGGVARAWVVNRFDDSVSIVDPASDTEVVRLTGAALGIPGRLRMETEIEFNRAGTRAYLSNENLDEVQVLDIAGANFDVPVLVASIDVGVNPRGMTTNAADTRLYVANVQSADVSVVDIGAGSATENQVLATIAARATDDIVGGRADGWEAFVIGGRAPRGIAYSDARNLVFVTSIGPQTGPRAGVDLVGGSIVNPVISVIDPGSNAILAHVALNGPDPDRFSCSDPELLVVDDAHDRLYVTCQGSGTIDVLDMGALAAGLPAELATVEVPVPSDVAVPNLVLNPQTGSYGAKVCSGQASNRGAACTSDADCTGCPARLDGVPHVCCSRNNPQGLHNGPRGIAFSAASDRLYVVNQFTASVTTFDTSSADPAFVGTASFPGGAFGTNTAQRDRRLGQIEFFTDLKKTNVSCATCHIDDHQDGVFFEADVAGPRLRRVLSVRGTRDTPPLLQDQLLPDLTAFTDIVVHVERGGPICTPCTELNGVFTCIPAPQGTCTMTSNSENQQNTAYAKAITFFPNPNLAADGSLSTAVPLPGNRTGNAVHGEALFDQLACASCHPEPLFTLDQFRVFNVIGLSSVQSVRMREVGTPVMLPLRTRCQDGNRPTGADGSSGFGVPTLRGIWDTFPLLMSGAAGLQVVGSEPGFTGSCTDGSSGCCTQLRSPLNPTGTPVPPQHLAVSTKDALRAMLTAPLAVPGTGHGAALGLAASDLDDLIAYLRSL